MQYQANHGWCGYDPLIALQSGVSAAIFSSLVVFTGIELFALAGMGLQGICVLFNWLPAFSAGLKFSAAAGSAAVWFLTGNRKLPSSNLLRTRQSTLSPYRKPAAGEAYIRYESGHQEFTKVTQQGGLRPGTYAAPASEGLLTQTELSIQGGKYNLPSPTIPRKVYYLINPTSNDWIIGPKPVLGGTGSEVIFPFGTGPGTIIGPYQVPP